MARRARGLVCVFAKPPRPGRVKTRLAPLVGEDGAARLARAFLKDTLASVRSIRWAEVVVAVDGEPADIAPLTAGLRVWPQGDGDLGEKLERVLARALEEAPYAIAIGSDAPGMPTRLLDDARAALDRRDAVMGPSDDGGFYLLGLERYVPHVLQGVPWSTRETCARTLVALRERGYEPGLLAPWFDVDEPSDLARLDGMLARGEIVAPATAGVLASLPRRSTLP